ncbi:cytoskeleton-associated protein 2-like isoform X1 [Hoplias malabaricus]|uniref:cytoskeleton-associated protein 2-like isoform X1 n=2 Tax=Hoplias malabaricus TaxID=27720 RepID=UPI003462338B
MGTLSDEDAAKFSRTELRKQKLAEYLAAKGRLKPPNPKPYLKDSAVLKRIPGAMQKSQTSGQGKENSTHSAKEVKKGMKMGYTLTEKNINITSNELRTKAHSATHQQTTFKPTVSQTVPQQCRTHFKGTVPIKEKQIKPFVQTNIWTHRQSKIVKVDQKSMLAHARTSCGTSSFSAQVCTTKCRKQIVVEKDNCSEENITKSQNKFLTVKEKLQTMDSKRTEAKTITNSQKRPTQMFTTKTGIARPRITHGLSKADSGVPKTHKSLVRSSQTEKHRSEAPQYTLSQVNVPGNKNQQTTTHRTALVTAKQKLPLLNNVSKRVNAPKTKATACNNHHFSQNRCPTVKVPPNITVLKASVPQCLPQQSKSSVQAKGTVQFKTPKSGCNPGTQGVRTVPLDGKTNPTAAQEERLRKLQEWREARGITYKRPPMPIKPVRRKTTTAVSQNYWTAIEQEDEVHGFVCAVDQSLNDCVKLLQQGCPVAQIRDVLSRVPMAQKFAKYWICQVRLMEREGNLDVLPTFEEAIRVVREPLEELRSVVFEILKKKEVKELCSKQTQEVKEVDSEKEGKRHSDIHTPKPVGALIRGAKGDSSVIKYKITATPNGKKSQQREKSGRINGSEIRFFTPVRRSLRIEKAVPRYPAALQEHDPCVTSFQDLLTDVDSKTEDFCASELQNSPLYVYRENEALKDHVQVELVYEEQTSD